MTDVPGDITMLIRASASGQPQDTDRLMVALYDDLKRLAASHLRSERPEHTLHPTALVHEAYLKLVNQHTAQWTDRLQFFAIASRIIRRILIDHARERHAAKRGGAQRPLSLEQDAVVSPMRDLNLVALDEALCELAEINERQARIVELRFFGGLTVPEIAAALSIGKRSVDRDWHIARAWLYYRLSGIESEQGNAADA